MDKKVDKASDVEFAKAIADSIPQENNKHILLKAGAAYLAGRALGSAVRRKPKSN